MNKGLISFSNSSDTANSSTLFFHLPRRAGYLSASMFGRSKIKPLISNINSQRSRNSNVRCHGNTLKGKPSRLCLKPLSTHCALAVCVSNTMESNVQLKDLRLNLQAPSVAFCCGKEVTAVASSSFLSCQRFWDENIESDHLVILGSVVYLPFHGHTVIVCVQETRAKRVFFERKKNYRMWTT